MFKWLLVFLCVALGFGFFQAERLLLLTDLSTRPIDPVALPDYRPDPETPRIPGRPPVYLVSYADGGEVYFQNQLALAQSAQGRGVDFVLNYKRSLIDPQFIQANREIMDSKVGAGYWLWKPWVILDAMKRAPENAVIIYMDGGFIIRGSLDPLIKLAQTHPIILSHYTEDYGKSVHDIISRDIFDAVNPKHEAYYNVPYRVAGFWVLRNTPVARRFVEAWLKFCSQKDLIMNGKNKKPNYPDFKSHHHDQSILNAVIGLYPNDIYSIAYETELIEKYAYWVHRRPPALDPHTSLVPYYGYINMGKVDKAFFNLPPIRWLRKWMAACK